MMLSRFQRFLNYFHRYTITPHSIWLRQQDGWVELRRDEIAALKRGGSRFIVRYYNGQRIVVSLDGFSSLAENVVWHALRNSLLKNSQTRGLWKGAWQPGSF